MIQEALEGVGAQRRQSTSSNATLVKLLLGQMAVQATKSFKDGQVGGDVAAPLALMIPLIHAASMGSDLSTFPSFPLAGNNKDGRSMKSLLEDGCNNGGQILVFEKLCGLAGKEVTEGESWKLTMAQPLEPKKYPSVLSLPPGFQLNVRPQSQDSSCSQRYLRGLTLMDAGSSPRSALNISESEVANFASILLPYMDV